MGTPGLVAVATFHEPVGAAFIQSVLAGHGIDARLGDEHVAGLGIHLSLATGGIRVLVPADQADLAREVLEEVAYDEEFIGEEE